MIVRMGEVRRLLERAYPIGLAEGWDRTGFSLGADPSKQVTGVLLCLDLTPKILDLALERGVNLILTRHPFRFLASTRQERRIYPYKGSLIRRVREERVSVYSLHTNFERAEATAAREIVRCLFEGRGVVYSLEAIPNLPSAILVRSTLTIHQLQTHLKQQLGLATTKLTTRASTNQLITNFLLLPGSWSSRDFLPKLGDLEVDLIVTSELRWSDWVSFQEDGSLPPLLELSHIIETYAARPLELLFKENLPSLPYYSYLALPPYRDYHLEGGEEG